MMGLNLKRVLLSSVLLALLVQNSNVCLASKCSTCKDIVKNFKEGLEKTKNSNFGGGNTRWEEKSLGTWAHSETRLVEIWENYLCKHDVKECHLLLEQNEEYLEEFWFNVHAKNEDEDMHEWFCIDKTKVCCPSNTYGPKCKVCSGGKDRPCKGNGKCNGEGTRKGTGKCKCDAGYRGNLCDECKDGYFEESKNDTHTKCTSCHASCKNTCWEAGPKGCDECKSGWTMSEEEGCKDIDECVDTPCEETHYCTNTQGSYHCATCHRACQGCHGYGSHKCTECKRGYQQVNEDCKDINECSLDTTLCSGANQTCDNTDGSYECKCDGELIYDADSQSCIPKPKERPKRKESKDREKKGQKTEQDKPGLFLFLMMILVFYICGSLVQWNLVIVFFLSTVFGVFLYWFGTEHDAF